MGGGEVDRARGFPTDGDVQLLEEFQYCFDVVGPKHATDT